jgi:glutamyl/glutaminyl-tRNA synthetase
MSYPSPLNTRIRIAPSGQAHVAHYCLGKLSQEAARITGGTFTMRCQQLWATRDIGSWELYKKHAQENMDELQVLGVEPSHPNVFLSHGMSPDWRVQYTDDRGLVDAYWQKLRLDELWGSWPNNSSMALHNDTEVMPCDVNSWYMHNLSCKHPYIQFAQMVGDVTTGRNFLIRGSDHIQDKAFADAFYPLIAKVHYGLLDFDRQCEKTPCQFFLPRIEREGGGILSSSSGSDGAGYYLADIIQAGIPPDRLWKFMGRVLWGSYEIAEEIACNWSQQIPVMPEKMHLRPGPHAGGRSVMEAIVPRPCINATEWDRFMRSGGKILP